MDSLKIFEQRISRLKSDIDRVRKAKEALNLDQTVHDGALKPIEEEVQDLTQGKSRNFQENSLTFH